MQKSDLHFVFRDHWTMFDKSFDLQTQTIEWPAQMDIKDNAHAKRRFRKAYYPRANRLL